MTMQMMELIQVGKHCTKKQLKEIIKETPPLARYIIKELEDKGIEHIYRIRPELWELI